MIFTTTNNVEGRTITQYRGIVVGEAMVGVNTFKDMLASLRNIVGGRADSYEGELKKAREAAFEDLSASAREVGADAVIGVDLDYEVIDASGGAMMLVSISGTAVSLK